MGKATVLKCDKCDSWDSVENPVRTVPVGGPKFELCAGDRILIIMGMGVAEDKARAYVQAADKHGTQRGSTLSLDGSMVKRELALITNTSALDQGDPLAPATDPQEGQEEATDVPEISGVGVPYSVDPEAVNDKVAEANKWAEEMLADLHSEAETEDQSEADPAPVSPSRRRRK